MNYYNYFTEVEETFVRRRGKSLILSPLDWALIDVWREQKIPLHIVQRAIENVFDVWEKQPKRNRTVKSLAYCREEIEAQFAEWLEGRVGAAAEDSDSEPGDQFSDEVLIDHISESRGRLSAIAETTENAALRETLERVCLRLHELAAEHEGPEKLEQSLDILDDMIDRELLSDASSALLRSEVEGLLAPNRGAMDAEAYERTLGLMLRKKLRENAGIPRLSLFYL